MSCAIALIYLPIFARLARNMTAVLRGAVRPGGAADGQPAPMVLLQEILPNIVAALIVQATMPWRSAYHRGGTQLPRHRGAAADPSLGVIMADGREYFGTAPWVLTLTGFAISVALLGLNLLGDGLRDLLDPRLRQIVRE